jgi:hypothetical protein
MPPCAGLRAHVELSRISGYIVCETFQVAPRNYTSGQSVDNIDTARKMLGTWKLQLPSCLQMPKDLSHPDPSCYVLHMVHNQLMVLATRPVFFGAVKRAVAQQIVRGEYLPEDRTREGHMQACLAAAHQNLLLAQRVRQSGRRSLQADLYIFFHAAVILLLTRLLRKGSDAKPGHSDLHTILEPLVEDQFEANIRFAIKSFEEEAKTGTHYTRECCKILQDLNALTYRYVTLRKQGGLPHRNVIDHAQGASQANNKGGSVKDLHTSQPPFSEGVASYDEIMTWMRADGLHLHI